MVIDNCLRHALRIVIGIAILALLLAGGAGAATPISACTTISIAWYLRAYPEHSKQY